MPNSYQSLYTGAHNDEYNIRITALETNVEELENAKVNRIGDTITGTLKLANTTMNRDIVVADATNGIAINWIDINNNSFGTIHPLQNTTFSGMNFVGRGINNTAVALRLGTDESGNAKVSLYPNADPWLTALGKLTTTSTITDVITVNSSVATISSVSYVQWGKIASVRIGWKNKAAISVPANGNITNITIGTLVAGKRPAIISHAHSNGDNAGAAWYTLNGSGGAVILGGCEGTGAARSIAANTDFYIFATYILA